jgi:uncharacterized protein
MDIEFAPEKRTRNLKERGLDFLDVQKVFAGPTLTYGDDRKEYGEDRWITVGILDGRMVIVVWTGREDRCRVISLRKANDREEEKFAGRLA